MVEQRHFVNLWFNINVTLLEITKYPSQIMFSLWTPNNTDIKFFIK